MATGMTASCLIISSTAPTLLSVNLHDERNFTYTQAVSLQLVKLQASEINQNIKASKNFKKKFKRTTKPTKHNQTNESTVFC